MTVAAPSRCDLPGFLNAEVRVLAQACWLGRAGGLVPDSWAVMGVRARSEPAMSLVDRQRERAALDGLVQDLRSGRGRALVVRGEAGVGKSALLKYVAGAAADMRVARAVGVESEMELAFASLHLLCAPLLDRLEGLPAPQREARGGASGWREGAPRASFRGGVPGEPWWADLAAGRGLGPGSMD